jgi:hypothetical protein
MIIIIIIATTAVVMTALAAEVSALKLRIQHFDTGESC